MEETAFVHVGGAPNIYALTSLDGIVLAAQQDAVVALTRPQTPQTSWSKRKLVHVLRDVGEQGVLSVHALSLARDEQSRAKLAIVYALRPTSAPAPNQPPPIPNYALRVVTRAEATTGELEALDTLQAHVDTFALPSIPFGVYHALSPVSHRSLVLVPSLDGVVRAFDGSQELDVNDHFPELHALDTNILSLSMATSGSDRLTCVGGQDGTLLLTRNGQPFSKRVLDGPIAHVYFLQNEDAALKGHSELLLVVCVAVGYAILFRSVHERGFEQGRVLSKSDGYDSITCVGLLPADARLNAVHALIIGTYGKRLLAYSLPTPHDLQSESALMWDRELSHPLFAVVGGVFKSDNAVGSKSDPKEIDDEAALSVQLCALSLHGLHILTNVSGLAERRALLQQIKELSA